MSRVFVPTEQGACEWMHSSYVSRYDHNNNDFYAI